MAFSSMTDATAMGDGRSAYAMIPGDSGVVLAF